MTHTPEWFDRDGPSALLGYTGFVGRNLAAQVRFTDRFHSRDIDELAGREYALLVCAAAPGVKWRANREPEADRASLSRLRNALDTVRADRAVLISTVDVYPMPVEVDERSDIVEGAGQPYGRHRLELEHFMAERFDTLVIRLPGLFGPGLRKNLVFDLLSGNAVDGFHPDSTFQFYPLARLWQDVEVAGGGGLPLANLATAPISAAAIARAVAGVSLDGHGAPVVRYDMWTCHAHHWGRDSRYLLEQDEVLSGLIDFARAWSGPSQ